MGTNVFPPSVDNPIGGKVTAVAVYGRTDDPAKLLVGTSRYTRPSISIVGGPSFEWPVGTEGFQVQGQAKLAQHLYIGDDAAVLKVMHRDERRITLSGAFPGITGTDNMNALLEILTADTPARSKILTLPGVFTHGQIVEMESYSFDHASDDASDTVNYSVVFIRQGQGKKASTRPTTPSPQNPVSADLTVRGKSQRRFTVTTNVRTLRAVASKLYHDPEQWREIYSKNKKTLDKIITDAYTLPTTKLPLGMKLNY